LVKASGGREVPKRQSVMAEGQRKTKPGKKKRPWAQADVVVVSEGAQGEKHKYSATN